MYFTGEIKDGLTVLTKIEWEVHIIKNLKAKLLIEMDILSPKLVNIYVLKKEIYLGAYRVTILIKIHPYGMPIQRIVYI